MNTTKTSTLLKLLNEDTDEHIDALRHWMKHHVDAMGAHAYQELRQAVVSMENFKREAAARTEKYALLEAFPPAEKLLRAGARLKDMKVATLADGRRRLILICFLRGEAGCEDPRACRISDAVHALKADPRISEVDIDDESLGSVGRQINAWITEA